MSESAPLLPLDAESFAKARRGNDYLRGRWVYLRHVVRIIQDIAPRRVLEIGPGPLPLVPGSDSLDIEESLRPTFLHDAGSAPWPIESGSYDLVIGLQCWEHFAGHQRQAFSEALRAAGPGGHVLISVPFKWTNTNAEHRGIGVKKIREWTLDREPVLRRLVKKPEHRMRMILLFRGGEVSPESK